MASKEELACLARERTIMVARRVLATHPALQVVEALRRLDRACLDAAARGQRSTLKRSMLLLWM